MWETPPMLRPSSAHRDDILADVALGSLGEVGPPGLTASALARSMGVTPQALFNRYGNAERMMRVVVSTLAGRWSAWTVTRGRAATRPRADSPGPGQGADHGVGLAAMLPCTAEEAEQERSWLALRCFVEHDRGRDDSLAAILADADLTQRETVQRWLADQVQARTDPVDVEIVLACLDGLRHRLARATDPLDPAAARRVLQQLTGRLAPMAGGPAGPADEDDPRPGVSGSCEASGWQTHRP